MVLKALNSPSIDLLIVSFPSVSFDADDDSDSDLDPSPNTDADAAGTENVMDEMIATWRALESLHDEGIVTQLGLAEFGSSRLKQFLPHTRIRPGVDQINVRDCCVVPRSLILYAKEQGIQLLTHNDCTNILPKGTIRDILGEGEKGFGILAGDTSGVEKKPASSGFLVGEIEPQWVVKYTAVVTDRGVIENKGYFAMAEMRE